MDVDLRNAEEFNSFICKITQLNVELPYYLLNFNLNNIDSN